MAFKKLSDRLTVAEDTVLQDNLEGFLKDPDTKGNAVVVNLNWFDKLYQDLIKYEGGEGQFKRRYQLTKNKKQGR